jgi:hypothetical protein
MWASIIESPLTRRAQSLEARCWGRPKKAGSIWTVSSALCSVDGDREELGLDSPRFEPPGAAVDLLDRALFGERAEVVHGGVLAGVAELALDVAGAGRYAALGLHGADEIENGFLFFAEHGPTVCVRLNTSASPVI